MNGEAVAPKVSASRLVIATLFPAILPNPTKWTGALSPCPIRTGPVAAIVPRQMSPSRQGALSWPLSLRWVTPGAGGLMTSAEKAAPRTVAPRASIAPPESVTEPPVPSTTAPLPISKLATLPIGNVASVNKPPAARRMKPGSDPPVVFVSVAPDPMRMSSPATSSIVPPVSMRVIAVTSTLVPATPDRLPDRSKIPPPATSPKVSVPLEKELPSPNGTTPASARSEPPDALRMVALLAAAMKMPGAW